MPVGPARLVEVAEAVAAKLRAVNPGLRVSRRYSVRTDKGGPPERTAWVVPVGYEQAEALTRGSDTYAFTVAVAVAERLANHPSADEDADTAAVDALLAFVQHRVYGPLEDARTAPLLPAPCQGCRPFQAAVTEACDPDLLGRGVFYSELLFTFHETTTGV